MEQPTLDKFPRKVLAKIDIQTAFMASRLVVAAERLQVFRLLRRQAMTAEAAGRALAIHASQRKPFLDALVSLGLLRREGGKYGITRLARKYFVDERPIEWTRQYSKECVETYERLAPLEAVLASGKSYEAITRRKKPAYTEEMKRKPRVAEDFTQMLFHLHRGEAEALAKYLDLGRRRAVLDVAGGSGVMSLALAKKNPQLRACVLDIAPVCRIAAANARRAGLGKRVRTRVGDMHGPLPKGYDVVMFCDVGPVSKELLRNAFECLPPGGLVVLVDQYLSEEGTDPLERVLHHFAGSSFGLATWADMVEAVMRCGFHRVQASNVYRDAWFITGVKREE